jgi:hypothetical protein
MTAKILVVSTPISLLAQDILFILNTNKTLDRRFSKKTKKNEKERGAID